MKPLNAYPIVYRHDQKKPMGMIYLTSEAEEIIKEAYELSEIYTANLDSMGWISFGGRVTFT